jgi:hypothetical protein
MKLSQRALLKACVCERTEADGETASKPRPRFIRAGPAAFNRRGNLLPASVTASKHILDEH